MLESFRRFAMSFVVALFAWSMLYMFLVYVVEPKTAITAGGTDEIPTEEPYTPTGQEDITLLVMGSTEHRAPPGAYLLASFKPTAGVVSLAALPSNTAVINNGKTESLTEVYSYGGAQYTQNLISKTLGITIDRCVRLNGESLAAAMQIIGSMEYNLPKPLKVRRDGVLLEMQEGPQLLDGRGVLQILSHPYTGAEEQSAAITGLVAELVTQRRDIVLSTMSEKVFTAVINRIESDISFTDYLTRHSAAIYYAGLEGGVTHQIALAGSSESGLYHLSDTFIAELRGYFN